MDKKTKEIKEKIEFNNICIRDLQKDNSEDKKSEELTEVQKKKMAILEQKIKKKKEIEKYIEERYKDL